LDVVLADRVVGRDEIGCAIRQTFRYVRHGRSFLLMDWSSWSFLQPPGSEGA
jgi:hypothetical protein